MLSAMRLGFGGHIEGKEPIDPEPAPRSGRPRAKLQNNAMFENQRIPISPVALRSRRRAGSPGRSTRDSDLQRHRRPDQAPAVPAL